MNKICIALLLLISFAATSQGQHGRYYGSRSYYQYNTYRGSHSYYNNYQYSWHKAGWWQGRWYPAGYYYWGGHCWYLQGYGAFSGYDSDLSVTPPAPGVPGAGPNPPPPPPPTGLTPEEIAKLKELLKKLNEK